MYAHTHSGVDVPFFNSCKHVRGENAFLRLRDAVTHIKACNLVLQGHGFPWLAGMHLVNGRRMKLIISSNIPGVISP